MPPSGSVPQLCIPNSSSRASFKQAPASLIGLACQLSCCPLLLLFLRFPYFYINLLSFPLPQLHSKMATPVKDLRSKAELDQLLKEGASVTLHFWASWCPASAQMDVVFAQLCTDTPHARFFRVEAEETPEISEAFAVSAVPFFLFIKDGVVVDKLEGANPAELANKVSSLSKKAAPASLGMPAGPAVLEALQVSAKESGSVPNGNADSTVSETLKVPPPAGNGGKEVEPLALDPDLKNKLEGLVGSKPLMLFMKGTPEEPRCGFSRRVVETLKEDGFEFGSFDILSDEDVRQGMKAFSNWPTYPQLYFNGELVGGCDIVTEMHKSGELKQLLTEKGELPEESIESRLKKLIQSSPTMLFMKGTPDAPRCGFSSKVVNALKEEGVTFGSFDILSDEEVRQGLKTYSNWPTYPQLYHNGELIGGCDIILEMKKSGELKTTLLP